MTTEPQAQPQSAADGSGQTKTSEPNGTQLSLEETFNALAATWRAETGDYSSPVDKALNWNYQRIIGMGEPAVRYILEDLRAHGGHWYWALRAISGESPVPPEAAGRADRVREAWLQWGRERGYIR